MLPPDPPRASTTVPLSGRVPPGEGAPNLGIEWDAENRLTAVKQGGSPLASFTYDGSGRRATKTAGGITTSYVYDGPQFLEERPGAGTPKRYVYGPGIDRPLAQSVGSATSYFVADHLGSIVQVTDSAGTPTLTREYDPWGNLLQGSAIGGYAFTGREWDAEAGLYYYRARYDDPSIGRFLSEDSVAYGLSLYAYVANNPGNRIDPTGHVAMSLHDVWKVIGAHNYSGQSGALILCLIYRESTFDPLAVNRHTGFRGLMQLSPQACQDEGVSFDAQLFDPAWNVAVGTSYLRRQINVYHKGNVRAGLAAYGEGPHYADAILDCECCLKKSLATTDPFSSNRNPQKCLDRAKR